MHKYDKVLWIDGHNVIHNAQIFDITSPNERGIRFIELLIKNENGKVIKVMDYLKEGETLTLGWLEKRDITKLRPFQGLSIPKRADILKRLNQLPQKDKK